MDIVIGIIFSVLNIVLSIIAVWIAIKSSRDTTNNAMKQIEGIKQLSKIQIELSIKQTEIEIKKNLLLAEQLENECKSNDEINNSGLAYQTDWRNEMLRQNRAQKPKMDLQFYYSYIKDLNEVYKSLFEIKNEFNNSK